MRGWAGLETVQLTLLNVLEQERLYSNITPVVGDARDLSEFEDSSFDIVFSNSVIEHLFTLADQARMAAEVRRVGRAYWVQTPNYWFPMEPHFMVLGWHWLPISVRVAVIRRWKCGWRGPCRDKDGAQELVRSVRLMTAAELRMLFPKANIIAERFGGLVKSWIVAGGFPAGESLQGL